MSLVFVHNRLATTALLLSAIIAAWGLLNFLRRQPVTSAYWGGLAVLEVLMVAQAVLGLVLLLGGGQLARPVVHVLYGATAVLSVPAAYVYTRGRDSRTENLIYAVVCLWLFFIVERSMTTGTEVLQGAARWLVGL